MTFVSDYDFLNVFGDIVSCEERPTCQELSVGGFN